MNKTMAWLHTTDSKGSSSCSSKFNTNGKKKLQRWDARVGEVALHNPGK